MSTQTLTSGIEFTEVIVLPYTHIGGFVFDAFLQVDHYSKLEITQHPVQTGASIADHSFMKPRTLQFEIGMTDVNAKSVFNNQFEETNSILSVNKTTSPFKLLKSRLENLSILDFNNAVLVAIQLKNGLYNIPSTIRSEVNRISTANVLSTKADIQNMIDGIENIQFPQEYQSIINNLKNTLNQPTLPTFTKESNPEPSSPRSINAYKVLRDLQLARVPVQVATRLDVFENMLVSDIHIPDNHTTLYGLKASVTMQEILMADVITYKLSALPHSTDNTNRGNVQTQQPNESLLYKMASPEIRGALGAN